MNINFDLDSFFKTTKLHTLTEIFLWTILIFFISDNTNSFIIRILLLVLLLIDIFIYFFNLFIFYYKKGVYKKAKIALPIIYLSIIENMLGIILLKCCGFGIIEIILAFILAGSIWVQGKTIESIKKNNS